MEARLALYLQPKSPSNTDISLSNTHTVVGGVFWWDHAGKAGWLAAAETAAQSSNYNAELRGEKHAPVACKKQIPLDADIHEQHHTEYLHDGRFDILHIPSHGTIKEHALGSFQRRIQYENIELCKCQCRTIIDRRNSNSIPCNNKGEGLVPRDLSSSYAAWISLLRRL
jgi:hypothetical protein